MEKALWQGMQHLRTFCLKLGGNLTATGAHVEGTIGFCEL